jgi:hypothetical protein
LIQILSINNFRRAAAWFVAETVGGINRLLASRVRGIEAA